MALGEKIRQLDEQVAAAVRRALDDVRDELRSGLEQTLEDLRGRLSEVSPELPESFFTEETLRQIAEDATPVSPEAVAEAETEARAGAFTDLREALAAVDRAKSQNEILAVMAAEGRRFADRVAVLLLRPEGLVGWVARGFDGDDDVRSASVSAQAEGWSAVVQGGEARGLPGSRCEQLVSQLGGPTPDAGVILPLILRDRVSAVVYGDRTEAGNRLDLEALQTLTYATALALETLTFREREATATLAAATAAPAPAAQPGPTPAAELEGASLEDEPARLPESDVPELAEEAATEAPAPEAPEPPQPEPEPSNEAPAPPAAETSSAMPGDPSAGAEGETAQQPPWKPSAFSPQPPEPGAAGPESGDETATPPHGDEMLSPVDDEPREPVPDDAEELELEVEDIGFEDAPELDADGLEEYEVEFEEEPPGAYTETVTESPGGGAETRAADPTTPIPWRTDEPETPPEQAAAEPPEEQAGAVAEPDEPATLEDRPEVGAVPPPAPEPPSVEASAEGEGADEMPEPPSGGPVEPPADVEGPGWAFSEKKAEEAADPGTDAAHDEARRLARLLVSEIQLYNQEEVAEGRRNGDIYERLKDDIDRSRQLYEERIDPEIRDSTDYFYQELVRQLAAGDAKSLGI